MNLVLTKNLPFAAVFCKLKLLFHDQPNVILLKRVYMHANHLECWHSHQPFLYLITHLSLQHVQKLLMSNDRIEEQNYLRDFILALVKAVARNQSVITVITLAALHSYHPPPAYAAQSLPHETITIIITVTYCSRGCN